jgi:hypothetical protein
MDALWGILLYAAFGLAAVAVLKHAHPLREHRRWLRDRWGL